MKRRAGRVALLCAMLLAMDAQAQEASPPSPPQADVTTLGEVRALRPEDGEAVDLYRFRNPVQVAPNRFSRSWSEPPSPEQVGMSGGYVLMGINYGLMKAAQGLHTLTGGRDQIQPAIARPPPALNEDEWRRAEQQR